MNKVFLFMSMLFFFSSCEEQENVGGIHSIIKLDKKPREIADEICGCMKDAGLTSIIGMTLNAGLVNDANKNIRGAMACLKNILNENIVFFRELSIEDQRAFVKQVIHGVIESECVDNLLGTLPDFVLEKFL